jgi:hypothetical protein
MISFHSNAQGGDNQVQDDLSRLSHQITGEDLLTLLENLSEQCEGFGDNCKVVNPPKAFHLCETKDNFYKRPIRLTIA